MQDRPILILQMQRMGDLVMSFPLLAWLRQMYPQKPIWVMGEEMFFKPLLPLSPEVTYFAYTEKASFDNIHFDQVINLSHRTEAARIAGSVHSEAIIGAYLRNEILHVNGQWQLYRTSITQNNRYNLFHWADLNAMDVIPQERFLKTGWPPVKKLGYLDCRARIGLFLGASAPEKHPATSFWINLTKNLLDLGHKPVLLGGNAEKRIGSEVSYALGIAPLNLCGHFTVEELADFIQRLDLFVTPDTGPMHVANWVGTQVLNLSLGNVNPWETGPFCPGHYVLRSNIPCSGCWACVKEKLFCHELLIAEKVTNIIQSILTIEQPNLPPGNLPGIIADHPCKQPRYF